jgi:hypothetical protein
MENSSGQGAASIIPAEIDKWNWGAFLLNWIWGIGNKTFIALLMFVPFVNFIMMFVLGAKGSSWAWRNKKWESVEHFKAVQRKWAKWALIVYAVFIVLFVGLFFAIASSFKGSEAYKMAVSKLEANQEASQLLGQPVTTGFPMGNIEVSGPTGSAKLSFSANGPRGKGTLYMDAAKELGQWKINKIFLEEEGTGRRIDLNQDSLVATTEPATADAGSWFAGTWDTDWGSLTLRQDGMNVVGEFSGESPLTIEGKVVNGSLEYTWKQTNGEQGSGVFRLADDGNSIRGTWGTKDSADGGEWTGRRASAE